LHTWICTTLSNFFGPMQGAARIYAYLKNQGHDVSLKDLNQNAYFTLMSEEYVRETLETAQRMLDPIIRSKYLREDTGSILLHSSNNAIKHLLSKGTSSGNSQDRSEIDCGNVFYALLSEKEIFISEVDNARKVLDEEYMSLAPDEFLKHFQTLLCGKAVIDAVHFPAQLDFGFGFHGTAYNPGAYDIIRAVTDERHNFLIRYYQNCAIPLLNEDTPDVVGISITHTSDFVPAFTLARLIKDVQPEIHICLGGSTLTEVAHRVCKNPSLWELFDSLVLGPGEYTFSRMLQSIEQGGGLDKIPNLIYKKGDSIIQNAIVDEFDINDACTPEYVSVRPKSVLPLETSSGCYWGNCIFCYYPHHGTANLDAERPKTNVRDIELVLGDIRALRDKYDPLYIGLTDSCLHPSRMDQIVEQNLTGDTGTKFSAFIRFEKEFKSQEFCRKMAEGGFLGGQVGLESGSQRVNNIINKGVDLADAEIVIENLYKAGILTHLYTVVGIPGETMEDALMTHSFLNRWHDMLTLDWQIYSLYVLERSPLAARAADFGITPTALPEEFLVQTMRYVVEDGLSQEESTALSIAMQEGLKHLMHPLNELMDIESCKAFLLGQKAKGIDPASIKP